MTTAALTTLQYRLLKIPAWTVRQVALYMQCSESQARVIIRECNHYKPCGKLRIANTEVLAWEKRNEIKGSVQIEKDATNYIQINRSA
jgi:hypothetical protein